MLIPRIATALVIVAIFLFSLFADSPGAFTLLVSVIIVLGAWEWTALSEIKEPIYRSTYVAVIALLLAAASNMQLESQISQHALLLTWVLGFSAAFWLGILYLVMQYPAAQSIWSRRTVRLFFGSLVLLVAWLSLVYLRNLQNGQYYILYAVIIVAAADVGAYFAGKMLGKNKLAIAVSPGKSWEGFIGGVLLAQLIAAGFYQLHPLYLPDFERPSISLFLLTAGILACVSVLGDLFESMFKRRSGIKDSGAILPGHGGVLDRVDGLLAALPLFALIVIYLNG